MFRWLFGVEHQVNLVLEKELQRALVRIDDLTIMHARRVNEVTLMAAEIERLKAGLARNRDTKVDAESSQHQG